MTPTSVPPGFKLPWNTIRTMSDVWAGRLRPPPTPRPATQGKPKITPAGKIAFAGYDKFERL